MKRFISAIALCFSLLLVGSYFFQTPAGAQNDPLPSLLAFPAPPPPNPFYTPSLNSRDENFFDRRTPPPDDAPTEDLLAYWKNLNNIDNKLNFAPRPSGKSLERIMEEVEKTPEILPELVNLFPETRDAADFVKRFYDNEARSRKFESGWREQVKRWLTYHSNYYSDELFRGASQAADTGEYVTNQDELLALMRVDFERAKPLLDRMVANSKQPVSQTLARWALYQRALMDGDSLGADTYRRDLQATVENKEMKPGNRDLAMDALVAGGDYPGRDEWYFSLLDDETLYDLRVNGQVYTGLTTIINHSPTDHYADKMIELAGSGSQNVRNVAARNLVTMLNQGSRNPEIVRALVPWLENPKWAREVQGERRRVVAALRVHQISESVAGLVAMLSEKEPGAAVADNPNANVPLRSRSGPDSYPYRSEAIAALVKQKSPLAAAALRQLLPVVEDWERETVVLGVLVSGGFAVREQVEALEFVARANNISIPAANVVPSANMAPRADMEPFPFITMRPTDVSANVVRSRPLDGDTLKRILGTQLVNVENPSDELVRAMLDRIEYLEKREPQVANTLREIIKRWKGPAINSLMLNDLKIGRADAQTIVRLLAMRKELREKQLDEVNAIRAGNPTALGVSACLLEQPAEYEAILEGENTRAKVAVLACARLIRGPIAVRRVGPLVKNPDKLLALAAELYLESEDSPESRQIIHANHPNEIRVLGARAAFTTGASFGNEDSFAVVQALFASVSELFAKFPPYQITNVGDDETVVSIREELLTDPKLLGVYSYDSNFVRIYNERAVFSWQDDPARYRERELSGDEFEAMKNFLANSRVDEMPPFLSPCTECEPKELLMMGRAGGRRVFVLASSAPKFFADLDSMFKEFRRQSARHRYFFEKSVSGLEVLFADENLKVETLWKNGADFRLLIDDESLRRNTDEDTILLRETPVIVSDEDGDEDDEDEPPPPVSPEDRARIRSEIQQRERDEEFGSFSWMSFAGGKLTEPVAQPPGVEFMPMIDAFAAQPTSQQWKSRANGIEVRSGEDGLFKIAGRKMSLIRSGRYFSPVVTANGRWVVATKAIISDDEDYQAYPVRINLATNREFKIPLEAENGPLTAVCFIPSLNRVLLFSSYSDGESESDFQSGPYGESFLLDPETGTATPTTAAVGPLLQQRFRPLQQVTGNPDFFWAAVPDEEGAFTEIGVFHAKTLTFRTYLRLPKIGFDSMALWVDEPAAKFYFVYNGQLLALPVPKLK